MRAVVLGVCTAALVLTAGCAAAPALPTPPGAPAQLGAAVQEALPPAAPAQ